MKIFFSLMIFAMTLMLYLIHGKYGSDHNATMGAGYVLGICIIGLILSPKTKII